jgi:hypothetical protein
MCLERLLTSSSGELARLGIEAATLVIEPSSHATAPASHPNGPATLAGLLACVVLLSASCGYHPVYGGNDSERLHVVLTRSLVADAIAAGEVVSGAREALAKEGALAGGEGYPRIEVEVLRADESSEGIAAPNDAGIGASAGGGPRARATEVGLVARAHLVRGPGAPEERDTGDVRAMDMVASDFALGVPDPRSDALHHEDALRLVAHRLGERLALRILGVPTASDEGMGREP